MSEFGAVRIPGMGPEDKVDISKLPENIMSSIPGLDSGIFKDKNKPQKKVSDLNLFPYAGFHPAKKPWHVFSFEGFKKLLDQASKNFD